MTKKDHHLVEINRAGKPPDAETIPQVDRFKELARELGCDEEEAAFEAALKK